MISHIISRFVIKPVFGSIGMIYAMLSIGLLGFIVWSQMALQRICILIGRKLLVKNLAKCWNGYSLFSTFENSQQLESMILCYSENLNKDYQENIISQSDNKDTQSAGKIHWICQSSETQRKNSLDWLVGFIEGDGAILFYKSPIFVLTQKEGKIQYEIQDMQKIGKVRYYEKGDYYRYIINKKEEIYILINIQNGNIRLKKRYKQFKNWLFKLNMIDKLLPINENFNNAWLSGFTDAEGCFNVQIYQRGQSIGYRVQQRYILDQKDSLQDLEKISMKVFNGIGKISIRKNVINMNRYTICSYKSQKLVKDYFDKYPLKTKKKLIYDKWLTIFNLVQNKEHQTEEGQEKIRKIKKEINLENSKNRNIGHSLKKNKIESNSTRES